MKYYGVAFIENNNEHEKKCCIFSSSRSRLAQIFIFPFFFRLVGEQKKTTRVHIIVCIFLIYIFFKNSPRKKMHYEYIGGIKTENGPRAMIFMEVQNVTWMMMTIQFRFIDAFFPRALWVWWWILRVEQCAWWWIEIVGELKLGN